MEKKEIKHILWIIYSFCVFTILWSTLLPEMMGQSFSQDYPKEIRNSSMYDKTGTQLLEKYEYYFDYWAQQKVKHGLYTQWNKKGQLRYEAIFSHDQKSGQERRYYRNGNPRRLKMWKEGELQGKSQKFDRQGRLKTEHAYQEGLRVGLQKKWYPNGQLKSVSIFREGEKPQKAIRYNKSGVQKMKEKHKRKHKEEESSSPPTPTLKVPGRTTLKT